MRNKMKRKTKKTRRRRRRKRNTNQQTRRQINISWTSYVFLAFDATATQQLRLPLRQVCLIPSVKSFLVRWAVLLIELLPGLLNTFLIITLIASSSSLLALLISSTFDFLIIMSSGLTLRPVYTSVINTVTTVFSVIIIYNIIRNTLNTILVYYNTPIPQNKNNNNHIHKQVNTILQPQLKERPR